MKLRSAIAAILLLATSPVFAQDALPIRNCNWCHGSSSQGYMFAPRLAGQRPQYIENQVNNFFGHVRDNPLSQKYMWAAVARLAPQTAHDLASYFASLPPQAADDGRRDLFAAGRSIYEE